MDDGRTVAISYEIYARDDPARLLLQIQRREDGWTICDPHASQRRERSQDEGRVTVRERWPTHTEAVRVARDLADSDEATRASNRGPDQ